MEEGGVVIQGERINMLRCADDIAVIDESEQELSNQLHLKEEVLSEEYNLKINIKKTKVMACSNDGRTKANIKLNGEMIEEVDEFVYLGSRITKDGRSKDDIISRIRQAKVAFNSKHGLLTNKGIHRDTRIMCLKSFIWIIALYGGETWTVWKQEKRRLHAFEIWCYRRMLKIRWIDRVTNGEVLERIGEEYGLWTSLRQRRVKLAGHVLRHEGTIKTIMEGYVEGKRPRRRPRLKYAQQIMEDVHCDTYQQMKRKACVTHLEKSCKAICGLMTKEKKKTTTYL